MSGIRTLQRLRTSPTLRRLRRYLANDSRLAAVLVARQLLADEHSGAYNGEHI